MVHFMRRHSSIIFILLLTFLTSCKVRPLVGDYIQCGWSCFKLSIYSDSSYSMTIPVEVGNNRVVNGKWTADSKTITLIPTINSSYYFDSSTNKMVHYINSQSDENDSLNTIDSFRIDVNLTIYEYLATMFVIDKDVLNLVAKPKIMNYCNFVRLTNDSIDNERLIKRNRERCFKKSRQSYNRMVGRQKNAP